MIRVGCAVRTVEHVLLVRRAHLTENMFLINFSRVNRLLGLGMKKLLAPKAAPAGLGALLAPKTAPAGLGALLAPKAAPAGLGALLAPKAAPNGLGALPDF
jgi:hypothetical protein